MNSTKLNFARTTSSPTSDELTSSFRAKGTKRSVIENGVLSTQLTTNNRVNILGVGAMPLDLGKAAAILERWRIEGQRKYVCVISVHGLVVAQRDPAIRSALNHCGMATEDGMPLVWWSRLAGFAQARRVCGSDLLDAVCSLSASSAATAITSTAPVRRCWSY